MRRSLTAVTILPHQRLLIVLGKKIGNMLDQVINDGAEEGSDDHYYATQLLIKKSTVMFSLP
jgi:hypothetical protein